MLVGFIFRVSWNERNYQNLLTCFLHSFFFFYCSDITAYFMTALPLSLFYSQKNQALSPSSICHQSIDKIAVIEIPMVQAESGLQLS